MAIVTLGICVKNCEDSIGETISTIADQDYQREDIEAIVVDDDSEDHTLSTAVNSLSQIAIPVEAYRTGGKGLAAARQMVVENAKGKYVVWIDDGLLLPAGFLRKQVSFMEQNSGVGQARARWGWCGKVGLVNKLENIMNLVYEQSEKKHSIRLRGIGGSICRLEALRQVGGFDKSITGAGEDIEIAARLRVAGWRLSKSNAVFYYIFKETWSDLWRQHFWYGYGMHYVYHKHRNAVRLWTMFPVVGFMVGTVSAFRAYRLTQSKSSFLLPLHSLYKKTAWFFGFLRGHHDRYGHIHA
jgi:glycosyltransferase involved in cell wall biosynthesis